MRRRNQGNAVKGEEPSPVDISEDLPLNAREQKKKNDVQALPGTGPAVQWSQPLTADRRGTSFLPPLQEPQVEPPPEPFPPEKPYHEELLNPIGWIHCAVPWIAVDIPRSSMNLRNDVRLLLISNLLRQQTGKSRRVPLIQLPGR